MIEPQKLTRYRVRVTGGGYGDRDTIFEAKFNRQPTSAEAKEIAVKYYGHDLKEDDSVVIQPSLISERTFIL